MKRRTFNAILSAGLMYGTISRSKMNAANKKTPYLRKDSNIGLIAPSGRLSEEKLAKAMKNLHGLGFKTNLAKNAMQTDGYLAGPDHVRIHDLHAMYADPEIDAIWCLRGGYGATRILDYLNFEIIAKNPKPLIGYSDITALLNTIYQKTGNPCFHGPVAASTMSEYTIEHLKPLYGLSSEYKIHLSKNNTKEAVDKSVYSYMEINPGKAKGKLVGGNLTLVSSLVGTAHAVQAKNKLVFLEDIGEEPYRVDRMLTQLISSGFLDSVKGVILGIFAGCHKKDENSKTLLETIKERMSRIDAPSAYGFSFGHIDDQCSFQIGQMAEMDTTAKTITLYP